MKKLIFITFVAFCSVRAFCGTNAAVTANTNTGIANLNWQINSTNIASGLAAGGFPLGGGGSSTVVTNQTNYGQYALTNTTTGAFWQVTTNAHVHATDENGTTFDTHPTNQLFAIIATNTNSFTVGSNGNVAITGPGNSATLTLTGSHAGGGTQTIQSTPAGLSIGGVLYAPAAGGNYNVSGMSNTTSFGTNTAAFQAGDGSLLTDLTNVFNALADNEVIICPYTNLPSSLTNSGKYFTPILGANYVQLAFNSLQYFTNGTAGVGGGRVRFVGINYAPNGVVLTNALGTNTPCSWDIEAPAFLTGALVGQHNPVLVWHSTNSANQLVLRNMIIASTVDQATNLIELTNTFGRIDIELNWLGPWQAMTNNHIFANNFVGLTPPTTGNGFLGNNGWWIGNLVGIYLIGNASDIATVSQNSFLGLNTGLFWNPDHGICQANMFSYCGTPATNLWATSSLFSLHCAITLTHNTYSSWRFADNYFYDCGGSYYVDIGYQAPLLMDHDAAEGTYALYGPANASATVFDPAGGGLPIGVGITFAGGVYSHSGNGPAIFGIQMDTNNGFTITSAAGASFYSGSVNQYNNNGYWDSWSDVSGSGMNWDGAGNALYGQSVTVGGWLFANADGMEGTFNGTAHVNIVGTGSGVTNTSTNYGLCEVSNSTAAVFTNFNTAGTAVDTNSVNNNQLTYPVGPGSGVKAASGALSKAVIIFQ